MIEKIWEGVFKTFDEAPKIGEGFHSKRWIEKSFSKLLDIEDKYRKKDGLDFYIQNKDTLFSIVSILHYLNHKSLNILDFGGGMGLSFFPILHHIGRADNFDYHVVEIEKICDLASDYLHAYTNLHFHASLPPNQNFDVVYLGSSLHYINDWKGLLSKLAGYCPTYFVFSDTPITEEETFVTIQNYYESKIPVRFLRRSEFVAYMASLDFELPYSTPHMSPLNPDGKVLPMGNMDPAHRIDYTTDFLFQREERK